MPGRVGTVDPAIHEQNLRSSPDGTDGHQAALGRRTPTVTFPPVWSAASTSPVCGAQAEALEEGGGSRPGSGPGSHTWGEAKP